MGHDDAHQAGEAHGCKRRGTVMLMSTKDTVILPVKMYTLECGYRGCGFQTGDHVPSALEEDHKWLLETHFELEHTVPPLEMVEGAVDRVSWNTFVEWWRHQSAVLRDPGEDRKMALKICLGAVGTALCDKLGDRYFKLSELDLLLEVMKITRNVAST